MSALALYGRRADGSGCVIYDGVMTSFMPGGHVSTFPFADAWHGEDRGGLESAAVTDWQAGWPRYDDPPAAMVYAKQMAHDAAAAEGVSDAAR